MKFGGDNFHFFSDKKRKFHCDFKKERLQVNVAGTRRPHQRTLRAGDDLHGEDKILSNISTV